MQKAANSRDQDRSVWQSEDISAVTPLEKDETCDVCVVGAGVSGIAAAYELARRGLRIVLLESNAIASGQTARSTAHLVTALDERSFLLSERYGQEIARAAAQAHGEAIDWIESIIDRAGIDCGFARLCGTLVVPQHRERCAEALLLRERDASLRAGVVCEMVDVSSIGGQAFPVAALRFPNQAQVDPVRFVQHLAAAATSSGARIHGGTRVLSFHERENEVHTSTDRGFHVRSKHLVLCTHSAPEILTPVLRPMASVVSHVVALDWPGSGGENRGELLWDGYWDDDSPYHYVRMIPSDGELGSLLLVGGEDETGVKPTCADRAFASLEHWSRTHFPACGARRAAWWGRIIEPEGEFALIGRVPGQERTFIVSGDSGNGMTYAAIAARRLADLICEQPTPAIEDAMFHPGIVLPRVD